MQRLRSWFLALDSQSRKKLLIAGFGSLVVLYLLLNQQAEAGKPEATLPAEEIEFAGSIFVHVVGEVNEPGLYELQLGARVSDAIEVAGGFTPDAVQSSVNLARNLSDGEQVIIASEDQFQSASGTGGLVSLNRASVEDLDTLPGVGPALAARIIEYRESVGSFSDVRELREVSGIGEKMFAKIKDLVTL
jgi:competence protein ComEA